MRNIFIIAVLVAAWLLAPLGIGSFSGVKDAWAVKPPTVKERQESVSNPDQHNKVEWFGRESRTTGGVFCNCGVSKIDKSKCYHPDPGQICRNPETGDTHIVKIEDWNNPVKAFERR
jgi:hypothetical protein